MNPILSLKLKPLLKVFILSSLAFILSLQLACQSYKNKTIVGETVELKVIEADMTFLCRVDTGAATTSLHAVDIQIENESDNPEDNVGKQISFTTRDAQGNEARVKTQINRVASIKNSQGEELRYTVKLTLQYKNKVGVREVNLRDRTQMSYKLLVGRNCLTNALVEI